MAIRVGIDGFGRSGRNVLRAGWGHGGIGFVAVTDITDARTLAHVLQYDSIHGRMPQRVSGDQDAIIIDGKRVRVPTANVSIGDRAAELNNSTTEAEINAAKKMATEGPLKGVLAYCHEPLVSVDFNGSAFASIFDSLVTKVMDGTFVKVLSWYDNEWGFSSRMGDVTRLVGTAL